MFTPTHFNNFLRENNLINGIYEAMESDDYSDVVMAALNALEKANLKPNAKRQNKCEKLSDSYRNEGNVAFKRGDALLAMHHYNKALRYAPNKSRAMLLAYSNRSAVLFTHECFCECLSDIETCFRLGCPSDIVEKLNKRKESITAKISFSVLVEIHASYKKNFEINNRNANVPCASADVEIVVKDGAAKITAAKDIKVGTILADESPFVVCNNFKKINKDDACRNCFSTSYNLIPCDGCCLAMFCSEKCKRKCIQDYHNVECQIMDVVAAMDYSSKAMLMVAGALKFVQMCGTWKEAILESHCTGSKRRRVSKASQMFDFGNKLSILNYEEDNIFVHGNMYEMSFACATIIESLDKLTSYFPRSPRERALAKRALARIMMYLALYAKSTQVVIDDQAPLSRYGLPIKFTSQGLYPFIGKLQDSCMPNTIIAQVCNKTMLIALRPVTKGSELTVYHRGHYLDDQISSHEKNLDSFILYGSVCKCIICTNQWRTQSDILTEKQLAAYKKYVALDRFVNPTAPLENFSTICETLACLSSAPFSEAFIVVYTAFCKCIGFGNYFLQHNNPENLSAFARNCVQ